MLIILDACRVDALEAVAPEYDFIRSIESVYSVGSTSSEWITKTFTESHRNKIGRTSYVTGNAYAELILREQKYPPATEINSISFPVPICSPNWETLSEDDLQSLDMITQISKKKMMGQSRPDQ
jgi:hypothetical protein